MKKQAVSQITTIALKTLGEMIKVARKSSAMSQQELADIALDGNSAHLSRIINGQRI